MCMCLIVINDGLSVCWTSNVCLHNKSISQMKDQSTRQPLLIKTAMNLHTIIDDETSTLACNYHVPNTIWSDFV